MPSELVDIRAALPNSNIIRKSGFDYYVNQLENGTEVIHVCSGIAKVNAAVCTQALIDNFQPDAIINAGIAGGMHRDVKVCDIVISDAVLPHDLDLHFLKDYPPYCGIFSADKHLMEVAAKPATNWACSIISEALFPAKLLFPTTLSSRRFKNACIQWQSIWKVLRSDTAAI